jgi:RNA polymerase sigma-70 factor (ECF subfamily)
MSSDALPIGLPASLKKSSLVSESVPQKTTTGPSDNDLIEVLKNKTKDLENADIAFGQLFDRYYVAVRSVARKILRNPEDVADVIQEAFMDVYLGARSFDPAKGSLKTWISYVAYHRSVKRIRLLKKREWQTGDSDEALSVPDPDVTPDDWIRSLDFGRSLDVVLANLNEKQRRTMVLHFFDGVEMETIATLLGETVGNARNHLYRGLAKLRSQLMQNHLLVGYMEIAEDQNKEKVRR